MRWFAVVLALALFGGVCVIDGDAIARPGKSRSRLDSTFGRDGVVALRSPSQKHPRRTFRSRNWELRDAVAGESGRVYVLSGGSGAASSTLTAYDPEGRLDRAFGSDGALALGVLGEFYRLEIDSAGRILVVGPPHVAEGDQPGGLLRIEPGAVLIRVLPEGRLDPLFGSGGVQRPTSDLYPLDVATDDSGRVIVLAGSIDGAGPALAALRLDAEGALDETYGRRGLADFSTGAIPGNEYLEAWTVDATGRCVALLWFFNDGSPRLALARLDATGRNDTALGEFGVFILDLGVRQADVSDFKIDAMGRYVILGGGASPFIARLSPDGTPDATWSGTPDGVREILPTGAAAETQPWSLTIDGDVYYAATAHGRFRADNRGPAVVIRVDADSEQVWTSRSRRFKSGIEVLSARDDTVLAVGVERRRRDPDQDATSLVRVRFD